MKTLVLIDGNALIHRGFYALPPFKTKTGEQTNAVYGFTSVLLNILMKEKPDYIAVAFDKKGPTFRHKAFADYKATRVKAPDELYVQIPRVKEMVKAFGIPAFEMAGFEADDILGTLARQAEKKDNLKTLIVTGDLDVLQLVTARVNVVSTLQGFNKIKIYDSAAVKERYGLKPSQMIDYKALRGDPSDNIPGVMGIGEKTAVALLQEFGSLEKIYEELVNPPKNVEARHAWPLRKVEKKLKAGKEAAFLSQKLATIVTDVSVKLSWEKCKTHKFEAKQVETLLLELELYRLLKRFKEWRGEEEAAKKAHEDKQPSLF